MKNESKGLQIIDMDTGEILGKYDPKKPRLPGSKYVLIFGNMLAMFGMEFTSLQLAIIMNMDSNNRLVLSYTSKRALAKLRDCSTKTITNNLYMLVKKGLMLRESPNHYFVNPMFFTKANKMRIRELQDEYLAIYAKGQPRSMQTDPNRLIDEVRRILNNSEAEDYNPDDYEPLI